MAQKKVNIVINIPKTDEEQKTSNNVSIIKNLIRVIEKQIAELSKYQTIEITQENKEEIEQLLTSSDLLIKDCHNSADFKCNRNDKFSMLTYEYQRLSLKYETYQIKDLINDMEKKEEDLNSKQNELDKKYNKSKQESNNLIYNILGFIASYSIVSAAVVTFEKVDSIEDIIIFMTFIAFILITTLIGLNNFYKNNDENNQGLRNNYFLWKALIIVLVGMILYKSVIYIKRNINDISYNIGRGIESIRQVKD